MMVPAFPTIYFPKNDLFSTGGAPMPSLDRRRFLTPLLGEATATLAVPDVLGALVPGALAPDHLFEAFYREHGIGCAAMHGRSSGLRLSPHIYNTLDQVDHVLDAVMTHV